MPIYIARIELRGNPTRQDYDNLHAAMQKYGFLQTIVIQGQTWELPHAEYACTDPRIFTAEYLREDIKRIVTPIYRDYLVLVSRTEDVSGLLVPISRNMS
jgi:hypothetical protein